MKRLFILLALLFSTAMVWAIRPAHALSNSDFQAGRIIDDTIFFNPNLLGGPTDIQRFLNSKVPACDTNGTQPISYGSSQTRAQWAQANGKPLPPYTCLRDYSQDTPNEPASPGRCNTYTGGTKTSYNIIFDVAQACGINPGVLVVLLEKEQALVTDDWPWPVQYQKAAGYACPDTAPCDAQYYGFFNQVYNAAWQFRTYKAVPTAFNYRAGRYNYIPYNPDGGCGPSNDGQHEVFIQNDATAGLYDYTPYQPNPATLAAAPGQTVPCGAYGNLNFWRYFNNWFGSSATVARIIVTRYDTTTDKTGDSARIGFSLNQRPDWPVTIPVHLSDSSAAGFVSPTQVTITPDNWNRPDLNQIVLYGKDNGTFGAQYYQLITDNPSTNDGQFRLLTGEFVEDVTLTNFDTTSQMIYRLYSNSTGFHMYTASSTEKNSLISQGYSYEGVAFYYCKSGEQTVDRLLQQSGKPFLVPEGSSEATTAQQSGYQLDVPLFTISRGATVPVYRLYNAQTKDHFYTISTSERDSAATTYGYTAEGVGFLTCAQNKDPVYRLYNPANNDHFYTTAPTERDTAGSNGYWLEGVGFYIDHSPVVPVTVYRLLNTKGLHFYTTSTSERDTAIAAGYHLEGTAFMIDQSSPTLGVHRLNNPVTGSHFYTISGSEKDAAVASGAFKYEGIGFLLNP